MEREKGKFCLREIEGRELNRLRGKRREGREECFV